MPSIESIPIQIVSSGDGLTGQAEAVLTEVSEMLKRLLDEGMEDSIDLRSLPLSPADLDWLEEQLGRGEVEIVMEAGGRSVLTETAYPGVWLVTHRDRQDHAVAQFIEIAYVPKIVPPDISDVEKGYKRLLLKAKNHSDRSVEDGEE
jgi:hydrogenase-1 operon protein HyaF